MLASSDLRRRRLSSQLPVSIFTPCLLSPRMIVNRVAAADPAMRLAFKCSPRLSFADPTRWPSEPPSARLRESASAYIAILIWCHSPAYDPLQ